MNLNGVFILLLSIVLITMTAVRAEIAGNHGKVSKANLNIISDLRNQIQEKEKELENAEKVNKNFEKMIQLVNILGQLDTFLTDRTKTLIKKLAVLAEDDDYFKKRLH